MQNRLTRWHWISNSVFMSVPPSTSIFIGGEEWRVLVTLQPNKLFHYLATNYNYTLSRIRTIIFSRAKTPLTLYKNLNCFPSFYLFLYNIKKNILFYLQLGTKSPKHRLSPTFEIIPEYFCIQNCSIQIKSLLCILHSISTRNIHIYFLFNWYALFYRALFF